MMLVLSMGLCSAIVTGLFWAIAFYLRMDLDDTVYMLVALLAPVAGFLVGYLAKDSLSSPGARLTESALARETSSFGIGYGRDDQANLAGAGCLIFLLQTLAGGIYSSAAALGSYSKPGHEIEKGLGASIVAHLLEHGPTSTGDLTESLAAQGIERAQIGSTLSLLRKATVLEPTPDRLSISPLKRHLFDACL